MKFIKLNIKKLLKNTLNIGILSVLLSSCSVGGMVYDDLFGNQNSVSPDRRRPVGASTQQFNQMPQGQFSGQYGGQNMSLAQLGYSGVNGGFSQNQQMPPVQYGAPNMPVYNPPMPAQQFQP
ncbi:MAG: hypothetical protein SFT90_04905, partial [Rickettsiales bacterium]|nr:hypothetical protein [Rickettsiales bacterium]